MITALFLQLLQPHRPLSFSASNVFQQGKYSGTTEGCCWEEETFQVFGVGAWSSKATVSSTIAVWIPLRVLT